MGGESANSTYFRKCHQYCYTVFYLLWIRVMDTLDAGATLMLGIDNLPVIAVITTTVSSSMLSAAVSVSEEILVSSESVRDITRADTNHSVVISDHDLLEQTSDTGESSDHSLSFQDREVFSSPAGAGSQWVWIMCGWWPLHQHLHLLLSAWSLLPQTLQSLSQWWGGGGDHSECQG